MTEWREKRQDERIERLEDDLREAKQQIRALERRPYEWVFKAEMAILWILIAAAWILAIVYAASQH